MSSAASILRQRIVAACRDGAVGLAAGVPLETWADEVRTHVFSGLAGALGGRNRGRLPFLEIEIASQGMAQAAGEGGTLTQRIIVRAHVGGADAGVASDLTAAILGACAAQIRSQSTDNLTALGDDEIGELQTGPWGLQRDLSLTVEQSYARDDYGVT